MRIEAPNRPDDFFRWSGRNSRSVRTNRKFRQVLSEALYLLGLPKVFLLNLLLGETEICKKIKITNPL